jgi:hypothetical protein
MRRCLCEPPRKFGSDRLRFPSTPLRKKRLVADETRISREGCVAGHADALLGRRDREVGRGYRKRRSQNRGGKLGGCRRYSRLPLCPVRHGPAACGAGRFLRPRSLRLVCQGRRQGRSRKRSRCLRATAAGVGLARVSMDVRAADQIISQASSIEGRPQWTSSFIFGNSLQTWFGRSTWGCSSAALPSLCFWRGCSRRRPVDAGVMSLPAVCSARNI